MHSTTTTNSTLSESDRRILETCEWVRNDRYRVSVELGLGIVGYHRRLLELIDDPVAERERPVLIHRLQRRRASMREDRSGCHLPSVLS